MKTTIGTFLLFIVMTFLALYCSNFYIAYGAAFFAGAFLFVGIGLVTEKPDMYGRVKGLPCKECSGTEYPHNHSKPGGESIGCYPVIPEGTKFTDIHIEYGEGTFKQKVKAEEQRMNKKVSKKVKSK